MDTGQGQLSAPYMMGCSFTRTEVCTNNDHHQCINTGFTAESVGALPRVSTHIISMFPSLHFSLMI